MRDIATGVESRLSRVVLGTVQLGLPYGRRREAPLLDEAQAYAVLDAAWELGIRAFDTAEGYGEAAPRLARWIRSRAHGPSVDVVTKVKPDEEVLDDQARSALARFNDVGDVTLLTHGAAGDASWTIVQEAAAVAGRQAGESVYTADEVRRSCERRGSARVQVPGNVFDMRGVRARGESRVPLDVRSVYLQGVLLDAPPLAERRVAGGGALAAAVAQAAAEVGGSADALLISAMLDRCRQDDRIVLGVDGPEQLQAISSAMDIPSHQSDSFTTLIAHFSVSAISDRVFDPRLW